MKYSNKYGLPDAFVRAVINDSYSMGRAAYSATGLANPARATALIKQFKDTLEVDVSSRVAAIIGQGAHFIAERAARPGIDLCEERLFAEIEVDGEPCTITSQVDLYETDTGQLLDWKTTKAYAFSKKAGNGKKPEWIQQLNVGAEILRRNKHNPKSLHIIAMLKDWNLRDAGTGSHPASEVLSVDLPMWSSEKTMEYITERIRAHRAAKHILPECTPAETWSGRKCGQWCDASTVCEQYKQMLKTGLA